MTTPSHWIMNNNNQQSQLKIEQSDMDSFFDFNQGSNQSPTAASNMDVLSAYDGQEHQQFNGPSHDYGQFKQQVGLPVGSLANMPQMGGSMGMYDGFNSGISEMDFAGSSDFGWNSGLDMDGDMGMDLNSAQPMPPMFFPAPTSPATNFINPNNLGANDEPQSNVGRLWPGMHSQQAQQAAMQKQVQAQAMHQRQMKLQAQQAQYRQAASSSQSQSSQGSAQQSNGNGNGKRASHVTEPHVEESISRLLNQMRQNSSAGADDDDSQSDLLPHVARMKKDEEDMDEDERLLASEEGKKLSSKERRQLRNKVSARAFRSRRKEYIQQLEGELAVKTQEGNNLRTENQALRQENDRYRGLIETLLHHPAFMPFINDLSKDPSVTGVPPQQQQQLQQQTPSSVTPTPQPQQQEQTAPPPPQQDAKPFPNFDASQLQIPQQQQAGAQRVGLAMIPENDFSKLNINGFGSVNFSNNYSVNAFAARVPDGPDPLDLLKASKLDLSSSATCASSLSTPALSDSTMNILLAKLDGAAGILARGQLLV